MADRVTLDLALQGGGAHGAFTWGVLDRLLDEPGLRIGAVSGASAGAMNAVVLADGLLAGGRRGAQKALWRFWKRVSRAAHGLAPGRSPFHALLLPPGPGAVDWSAFGPAAAATAFWMSMAETLTRTFSPYQFNPLNLNPLADIVAAVVDFPRLRAAARPKVFVSATEVRTGALRVFRNADLSAAAVMASACLPQLFQAVEIGGEAYWDGGYTGNPPLLPLIAESAPADLLVVQLNPPVRSARPRTADAIAARLNEITFNASLAKELASVALLKEALADEAGAGRLRSPLLRQVAATRLHRIAADETVVGGGTRAKLNPEWNFLVRLHGAGRRAAEAWLRENRAHLGHRSTLDPGSL